LTHRFDVDSNLLSYPAHLSVFKFCPRCNQFIFRSFGDSRLSKSPQILSKFGICAKKKETPMLAWYGQRGRHGDNLIARTARRLRKQTYVQIFGARPQLLSTEQIVVSLPVLSTAVSRVRRSESVVHNYRPLYWQWQSRNSRRVSFFRSAIFL